MVLGEQQKLYTVETFLAYAMLPENELRHLELENGIIVEMPMPRIINSIIGASVGGALNNFVMPRDLGYITSANAAYKTGERHVRLPNAAFITKARVSSLEGIEFDGAPDLAVEVVSGDEDVRKKAQEYLRAGGTLVWAVYLDEREVVVFTQDADGALNAQTFTLDDTLSGDPVLPGFTLPVRDIFPIIKS
ncbi:MAG: Uma2 family endonuclease [Armatimonadetes bacterium]|nr:Uma2 family endonuclease [Anaerolineae bacterium]